MEPDQKLLYFEYVLHRLIEWYESGSAIPTNDFSILKSIKLLFFVSAAGGNKEENALVDEVFDHFVAMPYGHVESDIYDRIRNQQGRLTSYQIDNNRTQRLDNYNFDNLDRTITGSIDKAIEYLKNVNPSLVKMSPFDLVDLSHAWYSWQKYYAMARQQGQRSLFIPAEVIKTEDKIYSLNTF